jgi:hypothetical protein
MRRWRSACGAIRRGSRSPHSALTGPARSPSRSRREKNAIAGLLDDASAEIGSLLTTRAQCGPRSCWLTRRYGAHVCGRAARKLGSLHPW